MSNLRQVASNILTNRMTKLEKKTLDIILKSERQRVLEKVNFDVVCPSDSDVQKVIELVYLITAGLHATKDKTLLCGSVRKRIRGLNLRHTIDGIQGILDKSRNWKESYLRLSVRSSLESVLNMLDNFKGVNGIKVLYNEVGCNTLLNVYYGKSVKEDIALLQTIRNKISNLTTYSATISESDKVIGDRVINVLESVINWQTWTQQLDVTFEPACALVSNEYVNDYVSNQPWFNRNILSGVVSTISIVKTGDIEITRSSNAYLVMKKDVVTRVISSKMLGHKLLLWEEINDLESEYATNITTLGLKLDMFNSQRKLGMVDLNGELADVFLVRENGKAGIVLVKPNCVIDIAGGLDSWRRDSDVFEILLHEGLVRIPEPTFQANTDLEMGIVSGSDLPDEATATEKTFELTEFEGQLTAKCVTDFNALDTETQIETLQALLTYCAEENAFDTVSGYPILGIIRVTGLTISHSSPLWDAIEYHENIESNTACGYMVFGKDESVVVEYVGDTNEVIRIASSIDMFKEDVAKSVITPKDDFKYPDPSLPTDWENTHYQWMTRELGDGNTIKRVHYTEGNGASINVDFTPDSAFITVEDGTSEYIEHLGEVKCIDALKWMLTYIFREQSEIDLQDFPLDIEEDSVSETLREHGIAPIQLGDLMLLVPNFGDCRPLALDVRDDGIIENVVYGYSL